jgi:ribosomal protein S18 acetylase RimI-like enzyme
MSLPSLSGHDSNVVRFQPIEKKNLADRCLLVLRGARPVNAYLLEGVAQRTAGWSSCCLLCGGRVGGVLHQRGRAYLHLFLSIRIPEPARREAVRYIERTFTGMRALFGDCWSVEQFQRFSRLEPTRVQTFIAMESSRSSFRPEVRYLCAAAAPRQVPALVPLQVAYEIEEVGAGAGSINRRAVQSVLRRRAARGELSVVFHGGEAVAMAGVNARFEELCQIGSVYVVPSLRGRGYGTSVVSCHLVRLFHRYRRAVLFVNQDNRPAYRLYRKIGFSDTGVLLQAHYG